MPHPRWKVLSFACWISFHAATVMHASATVPDAGEFAQRVFSQEQKTIAEVSKRNPVFEAYIQSLNPEVVPEAVLDDVYFLGKLALNVDSPRVSRFDRLVFGASERSRRIHVNTGDRWPLYPDGYVDMLFVDLGGFDEQHYALQYEEEEQIGGETYLRVAVQPRDASSSGRFTGKIWLEPSSLHIARLAGTFSPKRPSRLSYYFNPGGISRLGLYFHFETWRQQVSPGVWLPSYTYFDEERMWNEGRLTTSFRLRGHIWLWNYRAVEESTQPVAGFPSINTLESAGLLASVSRVERGLNQIVQEIIEANHLQTSAIDARVLLNTPAEAFSLDHTIFLSRGLLNLVPDQSTLAALVAREIAHILLQHSRNHSLAPGAIFDAAHKSEFNVLGIRYTREQELSACQKAIWLLKNTSYSDALPRLEDFLATLRRYSRQVPHLVKSSLGPDLADWHLAEPTASGTTLRLGGEFGINSWANQIVVMAPAVKDSESTLLSSSSLFADETPASFNPR